MIPLEEYLHAVGSVLNRNLNDAQDRCVKHPLASALMIVAGPGSGKTTVLVLRALRHILVDNKAPEEVLITTFTRKAAAELRSRLIGWGLSLIAHFQAQAEAVGDGPRLAWLATIDVNLCQTGTLDSFCQQWLGATREVGSANPVMLEEFAANFIYRRKIFGVTYRSDQYKGPLDSYLQNYNFNTQPPKNTGVAASISATINNRIIQDLADRDAFSTSAAAHQFARQAQADMLSNYCSYLGKQTIYDFSLCANHILASLRAGTLYPNPAIPTIKALLIDEYQDTNPMQEAIYFELAKRSGAAVAVVGDDDQALYRFRGATVELFTNFQDRFEQECSRPVHIEYLSINHRSTPQIIDFFNHFVGHDPGFTAARVKGKPPIAKHRPDLGIPILGMFRDNVNDLAESLADLLDQTFKGAGVKIPGADTVLKGNADGGALGDAVLLSSSVRELKDDGGERLPFALRRSLAARGHGVFNPRGQDLRDIERVQTLLGLVVLCLDRTGSLEAPMPLTKVAKDYINAWRFSAQTFVSTNPPPHKGQHGLASYIAAWQGTHSDKWPDDVPLLDLLYKLITWMPEFQSDPEHLLYLEAVMRCVSQGAYYSAYGLAILKNEPHYTRSRESIFRDLLAPIAERDVEIDEDLLYAIPRSRLSIMTIHQSKGLEFPLVIVDVGSEFKMNSHLQAFRRFPKEPSSTVLMESDMAPYTPIGKLRTARSDLDRTFDDLMRLYYVAYSRPQSALLLVGLRKSLEYSTSVKNIATFWTRAGTWTWRNEPPLKRSTPAFPEKIPFTRL